MVLTCLQIGAALHRRLRDKNRAACGYASVGDVSTGWEAGLPAGIKAGRAGLRTLLVFLHLVLGSGWLLADPA